MVKEWLIGEDKKMDKNVLQDSDQARFWRKVSVIWSTASAEINFQREVEIKLATNYSGSTKF